MFLLATLFDSFQFPAIRLPDIDFKAIIEILIMTYFFYKIIQWVKRTTAWSLFRGLIVVICVFIVAWLFELHTLFWILSNAFNVGLIAAIVIFQPELRSALERIGKNKFAKIIVPAQQETMNFLTPDNSVKIIDALFKMSAVRTGAFVVVENTVSLVEYEKTGTSLDAEISEQLLVNIFEDKTPLHDGAVIIKGNRIAAASCILPLTKTEIGAEYGTRHRAAVGISEVSDAHIVVVSEETGKISYAKEGVLFTNLRREDIEKILTGNAVPIKTKGYRRRGKGS